MKLRVQSKPSRTVGVLLLSASFGFSSVSQAQMMGQGYGMYGGQQPCGYAMNPAQGASSVDDELSDLQKQLAEDKKQKKEIDKDLRKMDHDLENAKSAISGVIRSNWAEVIMNHMDYGYNCATCATDPLPPQPGPPILVEQPPAPNPVPPVTAPPPVETAPQPAPVPRPRPGSPTKPAPPIPGKRPPVDDTPGQQFSQNSDRTMDSNVADNQTEIVDRAPASEATRMPAQAAEVRSGNRGPVQGSAEINATGGGAFAGEPDFGPGGPAGVFGSGGHSTLCHENVDPYFRRAWKMICRDGGRIDTQACKNTGFWGGAASPSEVSKCSTALNEYRRLVKDSDKLRKESERLEGSISELGSDIRARKREIAEEKRDGTEATAGGHSGGGGGGNGFNWTSLIPAGLGMLLGAGAGYLAYDSANQNNKAFTALGWGPQQNAGAAAAGAGLPFALGGIYGSVASGMNGAYGCGNTMGQQGMFGMPGYGQNPYGGGMFMPGMNGLNGMGGIPGLGGGGFAGGGGYPGLAGGLYGGLAGGGLAGGGLAGGGLAGGGLAGGGFAGYPGGGFAGYPGGGFAGYPGGGLAGGMYGGLAGGGLAGGGYSGLAGGMYGGLAGGGLAGGLYGGLAGGGLAGGGYPGLAGGMYGGLAGGGLAGGGYPGLAGGMYGGLAGGGLAGGGYPGGGYPGLAGGMYGNQQRLGLDNSIASQNIGQSLMSEYGSLQTRFGILNSGFNGSSSIYGSGLGNYGYGSSFLNGPSLNGIGTR